MLIPWFLAFCTNACTVWNIQLILKSPLHDRKRKVSIGWLDITGHVKWWTYIDMYGRLWSLMEFGITVDNWWGIKQGIRQVNRQVRDNGPLPRQPIFIDPAHQQTVHDRLTLKGILKLSLKIPVSVPNGLLWRIRQCKDACCMGLNTHCNGGKVDNGTLHCFCKKMQKKSIACLGDLWCS